MTRRYHAAALPHGGGLVSLDDAERHHALNVMRVRAGESIVLFDGQGNEALAVIQTVSKRQIVCESAAVSQPGLENSLFLTLAVAMPKGDRAKELVERLTELGVNRLVPVHCQRTQWTVPENAVAKWQRIMIDACKQCGRNRFMQIAEPQPLQAWLISDPDPPQACRYLVHPPDRDRVATRRSAITAENLVGATAACATIGPEGGFSDAEVELAEAHGWQRLSLGDRTYRIETAAILATIKIARL